MCTLVRYCITMSYFISGGYSLSSYLEYPLLVLQDVVMMVVVLWLGCKEVGSITILGFGGAIVALVATMVSGVLPSATMMLLAVCRHAHNQRVLSEGSVACCM